MNIFKPIVSFLQWAALELSKADGQPGLSAQDFIVIKGWVVSVRDVFRTDGKTPLTGKEKSARVTEWIHSKFGDKIPDWTARIITWAAFLVAKREGKV